MKRVWDRDGICGVSALIDQSGKKVAIINLERVTTDQRTKFEPNQMKIGNVIEWYNFFPVRIHITDGL